MSKHLKRLSAPTYWRIAKKRTKWTVSPRPGPHKKLESIPLLILVRDILKLAETGEDAKKIIKAKEIFVDGKARTDHKYPVGLFDSIEIPKIEKQYRIIPTHSGLNLIEIPKNEAKLKLCRINDKTLIKGKKLQLNLHDGKNIIAEAKKEYNTGDSLLIELPSQKIVDHVKMDKGVLSIITGGQNKGDIANVKEIITTRSREPNKVICVKEGKQFEAIKDYVFVIGKDKPLIKIE
jgi:small subunit ribosomal protein S4e